MVSVFSGKLDEELVKKYIGWFLPDKKSEEEPNADDVLEKKQELDENVSGEGEGLVRIINSNDFLILNNIKCYDHKGNIFEQYDKLFVKKDIERKPDKISYYEFSPYNSISYFEKQKNGLFLPSFALLSNIIFALFVNAVKKKSDGTYQIVNTGFNDVLMQFNNNYFYGYHNCNTIIYWGEDRDDNGKIVKSPKIIHYPNDDDFPKYIRGEVSDNINSSRRRVEYVFNKDGFDDLDLKEALKEFEFKNYLIDLTGLKRPEVLSSVAEYFNKPAKVFVPNDVEAVSYTSGTWLGSDNSEKLGLCVFPDLETAGSFRGVIIKSTNY